MARDREPAAPVTGGPASNDELVAMHRELERRTAELEATVRRKDELLAMVAHDLRNPLGSVAGFAKLLQRQLDDVLDASSDRLLERIGRLSDRMLRLVDDLLDVTVLDSGRVSLDLNEVDVTAAVEDAVASYQLAAARKGITIELLTDAPIVATVDEDRLGQVLDNLLANAVKYSPNRAAATITVTVSVVGDAVRVTVADEGIGIPHAQQERLFEPFGVERQPGTADERSVGLGLAITCSIVRAHGGSITVDSSPGHGSVFEVVLPRSPRSGRAGRAGSAADG